MNKSTLFEVRKAWMPRAWAKNNGDFISIKTHSGHALALADPLAPESLLASDASAEEIGIAVVNALEKSRFLSLEESGDLRENSDKNYKAWVQKLMNLYGYKNKRALFKNMKSCSIRITEAMIVIWPSHHDKLEGWSGDGFTEADYVYVSAEASPAEIGKALLLAFSRCTG